MPCLTDDEMCHRALGRWFLLGCLAISTVRRGCATAAYPDHLQSNLAGGHGNSTYGTKTRTSYETAGSLAAGEWAAAPVGGDGQTFSLVSGGLVAELCDAFVRWEASVEGSIGNPKRRSWEVSFREGPPWRSVEINCYLENAGTQQVPSSFASKAAQISGDSLLFFGSELASASLWAQGL